MNVWWPGIRRTGIQRDRQYSTKNQIITPRTRLWKIRVTYVKDWWEEKRGSQKKERKQKSIRLFFKRLNRRFSPSMLCSKGYWFDFDLEESTTEAFMRLWNEHTHNCRKITLNWLLGLLFWNDRKRQFNQVESATTEKNRPTRCAKRCWNITTESALRIEEKEKRRWLWLEDEDRRTKVHLLHLGLILIFEVQFQAAWNNFYKPREEALRQMFPSHI